MGTIGNIIGWIVFGLIAGAVARLLVPGRQSIGIMMTIILGIIGSFVGGALWAMVAGGEIGDASGWIGSIIGAVLVLLIYIWATGRRSA